jgi:hypothetical protein
MMDGKLTRELVRRRLVDNLDWGNLPYRVIEPLPPLARSAAPETPHGAPEEPLERPKGHAKRLITRLVTSIPFLGRAAKVRSP